MVLVTVFLYENSTKMMFIVVKALIYLYCTSLSCKRVSYYLTQCLKKCTKSDERQSEWKQEVFSNRLCSVKSCPKGFTGQIIPYLKSKAWQLGASDHQYIKADKEEIIHTVWLLVKSLQLSWTVGVDLQSAAVNHQKFHSLLTINNLI